MEFKFLYRDTTQPEDFIAKYTPESLIVERGYVDASKLRGGPTGNLRYLIFSTVGRDMSDVNPNTAQWGMVLINRNTVFKVLDVYKNGSVTQILLSNRSNGTGDKEMIAAARKDFDELANQPPVPALAQDDWKQRLHAPVGLDDTGNPFPLPSPTQ
jgi:hypothetical protein